MQGERRRVAAGPVPILPQVVAQRPTGDFELAQIFGVGRPGLDAVLGDRRQKGGGIVVHLPPEIDVDLTEQVIELAVPGPAQVARQLRQAASCLDHARFGHPVLQGPGI